jgi:two-component system sensor histidine kinase DegS
MRYGDLPTYDHTDQGIRLLEEERRRIARDLHDGPTQTLTNVSMRLELVNRMLDQDPNIAKTELSRINKQVIQSINAMRRLLFDLRPIAVDEVGFIKALRELCERYGRDYLLPVELQVKDDIVSELSPAKHVALYRLVQEVLTNVRKHAKATRIDIAIERDSGQVLIAIRDNGQGFDPTNVPAGHYGLVGMRERTTYLRGALDISSSIGQGSEFRISLPITGPRGDEVAQ